MVINLEKFHGFPNDENIWDLSDPNIPPMYTDGNPEIQRAEIQVNIEQQVHLNDKIVFVLKPGLIFFSLFF